MNDPIIRNGLRLIARILHTQAGAAERLVLTSEAIAATAADLRRDLVHAEWIELATYADIAARRVQPQLIGSSAVDALDELTPIYDAIVQERAA